MDKRIIVLAIVVLFLVPSVVAGTYTVTGTGDTSFMIPEGEELDGDPSVLIVEDETPCRVYINGHKQEVPGKDYCRKIVSLDEDDFNDEYIGDWWNRVWYGNNQITFTKDITNFTITYNTKSSGGGCSNPCPISFSEGTVGGTLCSGSAIPISTLIMCGSRNDYLAVNIEIYLESATENILIDSDCDVDGDDGWEGQCEATIPPTLAPGAYELRAEYFAAGAPRSCVIDSSFDVTVECSTNVACGHAGRPAGTPIAGAPVAASGEMKVIGGDYYVAPGSGIRVSAGTVVLHCSNGATSSGRPGLVAWTRDINTGAAELQDSIANCEIVGKTRNEIIGSDSMTEGFRPVGCDLHWSAQHEESVLVSNFNTPGYYKSNIDAMNTICDSPDYICPDLQGSYSRSNICNVGNTNTAELSDGWKIGPDFDFVSIDPEIIFTNIGLSQNGRSFRLDYDVTNTGVGVVKIVDAGMDSVNYTSNCTNCPIVIEEGATRQVSIDGVLNMSTVLGDISVSAFPFVDECAETGEIEFETFSNIFMEYDDGYDFVGVIPQIKSEPLDLNFRFSCDADDPRINVINVECGDDFNLSENVVLNYTIDNSDSLFGGYIDFGDGSAVTNIVAGDTSVLHKYVRGGNYRIIAFVNNLRNGFYRKDINVMVVDRDSSGIYTAACIDEPEDYTNFECPDVHFDASNTRAIVVSNGGATKTSYSPTDEDVRDRFSWYWRFMPEDMVRKFVKSKDSLAYNFNATFPVAGNNFAKLRIEFE